MKKKEGFKGQLSIVIPETIQTEIRNNPLTNLLYATDIGFYPTAEFHFLKRPGGSRQHVLIYCSEGSGWLEIGEKRYIIKQNMYFIIPKGTVHAYGASEKDPWSIFWVHFTGEKADLFIDVPSRPREIDPEAIDRNTDRILLFSEIYENLSRGFSTENLEYSSICLWHMLGSFRYLSQFQTIREIKHQNAIDKSVSFMNHHIGEMLSLSELSNQAGFSPSHYSLLFREKTGQTPLGFFTHLKIQHACRLFEFTDFHIKEVSAELGYEDPFYFSRVFKKIMGLAPQYYRQSRSTH